MPTAFTLTYPGGMSPHTGVSAAHGLSAVKTCVLPPAFSVTVKRYFAAPSTALKSNAGGWMNAFDLMFQNGVLPGTPGCTTVKLSHRACSFSAAQSGAVRAAPWMVAATAQTNSNRSSPNGVMFDILVHPFMFGIVPHYLE